MPDDDALALFRTARRFGQRWRVALVVDFLFRGGRHASLVSLF